MWFLFILVPAASSVAGSIFSLTGGPKMAALAMATNELQRRGGYSPGEGALSERAQDMPYSVYFDSEDDYGLNRDLGFLSESLRSLFEPYLDSKFDVTKTEAEFLRTMLLPAMVSLEHLQSVRELVIENSIDIDQAMPLIDDATDKLAYTARPVLAWFEKFPKTRTKKA